MKLPDGTCIVGEESGVVDGSPFVFLKEMASTDFGRARVKQLDKDYELITQPKLVDVDVEAVGANCHALIRKLNVLVDSSFFKGYARGCGFCVMNVSRPFNVGGAMGAGFEQRYRLTLNISYVHKIKAPQQSIDQVDITVYNDEDTTDIRKLTVKVP